MQLFEYNHTTLPSYLSVLLVLWEAAPKQDVWLRLEYKVSFYKGRLQYRSQIKVIDI